MLPTKENAERLERKRIGERVRKKQLKAKTLAEGAAMPKRIRLRTKQTPVEGTATRAPRGS